MGIAAVKFFSLALLLLFTSICFAVDVEVKGLFAGSAMLNINGRPSLLKTGMTIDGVTLISADSAKAVVEIEGVRHQLMVSRRISTAYKQPEIAEVRLQSRYGGHFLTPARINNRPVEVMVDTGATAVAMSLPQAKALGIDYRNGVLTNVSTASGNIDSYLVMLDSVAVGGVRVEKVEALINMSDFPDTILLGNSYLSRVKIFKEKGVLVLQSQY